ncbi:hypothetical protein GCM10011391_02850 [Pullulanibacillus camelliae]|uniref:Competence protein n=1 Tax=Pullulanibacillus camelliae TaxID=1707096 RepID=A0A8J2VLU6_9BACL|nr:competence protein ComK [Pullulanibacillus camelliae]GGE27793.1 hypothetical protein GCM10011391_02850 [Pullulanibacillus camelliae]
MENYHVKEHYIINPRTMALLPMDGLFGEHWTIIIEENQILQVKAKAITVIDDSCCFFGSSYIGRKEGAAALLNYTHMAPIAISDAYDMILFPLTSPKNRDCIWLSHKHIRNWQNNDNGTIVQFTNHQVKKLPIFFSTFEIKLNRAAQYRCKLLESHQYAQIAPPYFPGASPIDLEEWVLMKDNGMFEIREAENA